MKTTLERRAFIKSSACASLWALGGCAGFPAITSTRSPNALLRHGCVGTGNMAWGDINSFRSHPKIEMAAFCDVDANYLARVRKEFPKAHFYRDWREMLAKEGSALDSVNVSIPDHNHTIVAASFMRAGKHVYLQKPLCKTHAEAACLRQVARENDVITQMGVQYSATLSDRQTVEILRTGMLGPVERVIYHSTRKGLSRRHRYLPKAISAPDTLDWNLWLGTATARPYAPEVYHPLIWRIWRDLGSGWIGDIGCHLMAAVWKGMDMGSRAANTVCAETFTDADESIAQAVWPTATHIHWDFAGVKASDGKPFSWDWYDGCSEKDALAKACYRPPAEIDAYYAKTPSKERPHEGKAVKCRDGWILQPHGAVTAYIMRNDGTFQKPPRLESVPTHFHEFVNACLAGRKSTADFAWATWLMETILMGEIAEREPGRCLHWEATQRQFDEPLANMYLKSAYRTGWQVI